MPTNSSPPLIRPLLTRPPNGFQYGLKVFVNILIAESDHVNPARFQPCRARRVVFGLIRVGV